MRNGRPRNCLGIPWYSSVFEGNSNHAPSDPQILLLYIQNIEYLHDLRSHHESASSSFSLLIHTNETLITLKSLTFQDEACSSRVCCGVCGSSVSKS